MTDNNDKKKNDGDKQNKLFIRENTCLVVVIVVLVLAFAHCTQNIVPGRVAFDRLALIGQQKFRRAIGIDRAAFAAFAAAFASTA